MDLKIDLEDLSHTFMGSSLLSTIDYCFLGISLAVVLCCGLYHLIFSGKNRQEFFLCSNTMKTIPIAVSTAMVYIFALAVIQTPADLYSQGIQPFMTTVVTVAVLPVGTLLFVKMFHIISYMSVFQYLTSRFRSTLLRWLASLAFIAHQTAYTCIILGSVSFILKSYFGIPVITSIVGITAFSAVLTASGGMRGVVWAQMFLYILLVAFLSLVTASSASKSGGILKAFQLAADNQRLELFKFPMNIFTPHNIWNYGIGYGFLVLTQVVTFQPVVQRYSSTETGLNAVKSMLLSVPLYFIPNLLCLLIAIFLQAAYAGCDPFTLKEITDRNNLVPNFVSKLSLRLPGVNGAFVATIVGCAISIYSTTVNAVVACFFNDLISEQKSPEDNRSSFPCRVITLIYAGAVCAFMYFAFERFSYETHIDSLVNSANFLVLNAVLYGPLAGVFVMGLFVPCTNKYGATIGFLGGLLLTGYIAYRKLLFEVTPIDILDPIQGDCPFMSSQSYNLINQTMRAARFLPSHPHAKALPLESTQIVDVLNNFSSTISYLLLGVVGSLVTFVTGLFVSILTGGCCSCTSEKIPAYFLHPVLRLSGCCVDKTFAVESRGKTPVRTNSHLNVDRIYNPTAPSLGYHPPSYKYRELSQSPDLVV